MTPWESSEGCPICGQRTLLGCLDRDFRTGRFRCCRCWRREMEKREALNEGLPPEEREEIVPWPVATQTHVRDSGCGAAAEYYRKGSEYGREWTKNDAEADELTQLERWKASIGWEWDRCFDENPTSGYGMDELMVFEIWPDEGRDRQA